MGEARELGPPLVWRTSGGHAFHTDARCPALVRGQTGAAKAGHSPQAPIQVSLAELEHAMLPCSFCCGSGWSYQAWRYEFLARRNRRAEGNPVPPAPLCTPGCEGAVTRHGEGVEPSTTGHLVAPALSRAPETTPPAKKSHESTPELPTRGAARPTEGQRLLRAVLVVGAVALFAAMLWWRRRA